MDKHKMSKKCICGCVRGQFPAFKGMTDECRLLLRDLWEGIRMAFKFHSIPLRDCLHVFHQNTSNLHQLKGKALISETKQSSANLLSKFFLQEQIPGNHAEFFSRRQKDILERCVWRRFPKQGKLALRSKGTALFMSLLQTKRWISLVPKEMVEATLLKHKDVMQSQSPTLGSEELQVFRQICSKFGNFVKIQDKISCPTNKATFETPQKYGGYRKLLRVDYKQGFIPSVAVKGQTGRINLLPVIEDIYGKLKCRNVKSKESFNDIVRVQPMHGKSEHPQYGKWKEFEMSCECHLNEKIFVPLCKIDFNSWCDEQPIEALNVKPIAIPEPLKVRVITKSHTSVWLLKCIQESMTQVLNDLPVFELTGGKSLKEAVSGIQMSVREHQDNHFVSGDYDAATDNLSLDLISIAMEEILKQSQNNIKDPILRKIVIDLIKLDTKSHIIHYKDEQIQQTRGQLMGSLLSFPILCLVNYASVIVARKQPVHNKTRINHGLSKLFEDSDVRVNGDDLLFADTEEVYKLWKKTVENLGLSLSIGKNYFSKHFGTVNSRLLTKSAVLPVLSFGDVKSENLNIMERWASMCSKVTSKEELLQLYDFFKYRFVGELKNTNISLFHPKCLGGYLPDHLFELFSENEVNRVDVVQCLFYLWKIGHTHRGSTLLIRSDLDDQREKQLLPESGKTEVDVSLELWTKHQTNLKFNEWLCQMDLLEEKTTCGDLFKMMKGVKTIKSVSAGRITIDSEENINCRKSKIDALIHRRKRDINLIERHLVFLSQGRVINLSDNSEGFKVTDLLGRVYSKLQTGLLGHKRVTALSVLRKFSDFRSIDESNED